MSFFSRAYNEVTSEVDNLFVDGCLSSFSGVQSRCGVLLFVVFFDGGDIFLSRFATRYFVPGMSRCEVIYVRRAFVCVEN